MWSYLTLKACEINHTETTHVGSTPLFFQLETSVFPQLRGAATNLPGQTWRHAAAWTLYPFQGARGKCGPVALSPHFCLRAAQCELLVMVRVVPVVSGGGGGCCRCWWCGFLIVFVGFCVEGVMGVGCCRWRGCFLFENGGFFQLAQLDSGPDHLVEAGASEWPSWEGWEVESCYIFSHLVICDDISVGSVCSRGLCIYIYIIYYI